MPDSDSALHLVPEPDDREQLEQLGPMNTWGDLLTELADAVDDIGDAATAEEAETQREALALHLRDLADQHSGVLLPPTR